MSSPLEQAISEIQGKIQSHLDEILELKKAANSLAKIMGVQPPYSDTEQEAINVGPLRADMYYGKALTTAVREYLEFRRQAVPVEEILKGLEQGGFDFSALNWPSDNRLRYLAISISKNSNVFHRLPNGMWGLVAWYPEVVPKKKAKLKEKGASEKGSEEAAETLSKKIGSAARTTEPKMLTE